MNQSLQVEETTLEQHATPFWRQYKSNLLNIFNSGRVISLGERTLCDSIVKIILYTLNLIIKIFYLDKRMKKFAIKKITI